VYAVTQRHLGSIGVLKLFKKYSARCNVDDAASSIMQQAAMLLLISTCSCSPSPWRSRSILKTVKRSYQTQKNCRNCQSCPCWAWWCQLAAKAPPIPRKTKVSVSYLCQPRCTALQAFQAASFSPHFCLNSAVSLCLHFTIYAIICSDLNLNKHKKESSKHRNHCCSTERDRP
jgi:hypothetical protein